VPAWVADKRPSGRCYYRASHSIPVIGSTSDLRQRCSNVFEAHTQCHQGVTTRFKVAPADLSASSSECAYSRIVRLASLCPIHAAMTATGTPCKCVSVAQLCLPPCNLMCRTPAAEGKQHAYACWEAD
jgi:hypothetical protein